MNNKKSYKTRTLAYLVVCMAATLVACKDNYTAKDKCDGYVPERTELSKMDYNTVSQVWAYYCHYETANAHMNDTVLICGYVQTLGNNCYDYDSAYRHAEWGFLNVVMADTPTYDKYDIKKIELVGDTASMSWLQNYTFGQKMYFKVFCGASSPMDDRGCQWTVKASLISVDERSWR